MFSTQVKGSITVNFTASIAHLLDGGEDAYVESMMAADMADIDAMETDTSPEECARWHREAFRKQRQLQLAILTGDPDFIKRLVKHQVLTAIHEELEVESISEVISEPAAVSGTTNFFSVDMFSSEWELFERAHLIPDSCHVVLGNVNVKLTKIMPPADAPREQPTQPTEDLFSRS